MEDLYPPIAGGGLAVTGFYTGSAIIIGIVLLIVGLVLLRMSYFHRHPLRRLMFLLPLNSHLDRLVAVKR